MYFRLFVSGILLPLLGSLLVGVVAYAAPLPPPPPPPDDPEILLAQIVASSTTEADRQAALAKLTGAIEAYLVSHAHDPKATEPRGAELERQAALQRLDAALIRLVEYLPQAENGTAVAIVRTLAAVYVRNAAVYAEVGSKGATIVWKPRYLATVLESPVFLSVFKSSTQQPVLAAAVFDYFRLVVGNVGSEARFELYRPADDTVSRRFNKALAEVFVAITTSEFFLVQLRDASDRTVVLEFVRGNLSLLHLWISQEAVAAIETPLTPPLCDIVREEKAPVAQRARALEIMGDLRMLEHDTGFSDSPVMRGFWSLLGEGVLADYLALEFKKSKRMPKTAWLRLMAEANIRDTDATRQSQLESLRMQINVMKQREGIDRQEAALVRAMGQAIQRIWTNTALALEGEADDLVVERLMGNAMDMSASFVVMVFGSDYFYYANDLFAAAGMGGNFELIERLLVQLATADHEFSVLTRYRIQNYYLRITDSPYPGQSEISMSVMGAVVLMEHYGKTAVAGTTPDTSTIELVMPARVEAVVAAEFEKLQRVTERSAAARAGALDFGVRLRLR